MCACGIHNCSCLKQEDPPLRKEVPPLRKTKMTARKAVHPIRKNKCTARKTGVPLWLLHDVSMEDPANVQKFLWLYRQLAGKAADQ